ncbi:hypothetical protein EK0264_04115 [Epidermidibacterium keratini]|uniref:Uncharacterized protein n=1 Tax=Epidermidibacterium keratini TaxID=1891644 RepID=A0A7L4YKA3_9ACTN|nr:hypothetical protein [Epidermidibacterium keratini]QHB99549.1 hypothetical protein EK0264_04115 [Epidermidibacterium keratini]
MFDIERRHTGELSSVPESFTKREGRALVARQNAAISEGIVSNTRVQARGIVAATGVQLTGMLSREALFQAQGDPEAYRRCGTVVDAFALFSANEVRKP